VLSLRLQESAVPQGRVEDFNDSFAKLKFLLANKNALGQIAEY
jgi:hypothetical protein